MNLLKDSRTNWTYLLIVVIVGFLAGSGILGYYYWWTKQQEAKLTEFPAIKPPEKVTKNETANWKTYRNEEYGFEVKYPEEFNLEIKENLIEISSPKSSCEVDVGTGTIEPIKASEKRIEFVFHQGASYDEIWRNTFGFDVIHFDGTKIIGGREAKYFFQGAEMTFGRTRYLVPKSGIEAIEINTYIPSLVYNCDPPFTSSPNDLYYFYDQMLSTFRFLE